MSNHKHRLSAYNELAKFITRDAPDNVYAVQMQSIIRNLGSRMSALIDMRNTPNPMYTEDYNFSKVTKGAKQLLEHRDEAFAKIQDEYRKGVMDVTKRIGEKVKLKPNEYAAETRAVLREMSQSDRLSAIMQFAATNNGPALAAVTEAPAILSGVSEEMQSRFKNEIAEIHAKPEMAELKDLDTAITAAMAATDIPKALARDFSDPERLRRIEDGVEAATKAAEAFASPESRLIIAANNLK